MGIPVLCAAMLALGGEPSGARPAVLCTDVGASIDDQFALLHLACSPRVELRGVVTSHAPNLAEPAAETAAGRAAELLATLPEGRRPPVLAGSSRPLEADDRPFCGRGVEFLLAQSRGHGPGDRLAVLLTGPATDVASALLVDPSWADRVEVVAMAFDAWPEGGDAWNVKHDPRAWRVLLGSRVPLAVGDDAATRRPLTLTVDRARERFGDAGPAGRRLADLFARSLEADPEGARTLTGSPRAFPIWDEVVVAHLLGWTRHEARPRPALGDDLSLRDDGATGVVTWITGVEADRVWDDLEGGLRAVAGRE